MSGSTDGRQTPSRNNAGLTAEDVEDGDDSAASDEIATTGVGPETGTTDSSPSQSTPSAPTRQSDIAEEAPQASPARGRGFTEREIYVGYATFDAANDVADSFGANVDYGDQEGIANAIVGHINKSGGIQGRRIVPVFYDISRQFHDPAAAAEAACTLWTEDRPVFVVVNVIDFGASGGRVLNECLAKRQTPQIAMTRPVRPTAEYSRYHPLFYAPAAPSIERLVSVWFQRAVALDYFDGWDTLRGGPSSNSATKIGLLYRTPYYGAEFSRAVRSELARYSQSVTSEFASSGGADGMSELSGAVLRFKNDGVTHVVSYGLGDVYSFMAAAESQNYRPRYALHSGHVPAELEVNAPKAQLVGALGVGWFPMRDVTHEQDPGDVSPAQSQCRKAVRDGGADSSSRNAWELIVSACDGFNFLRDTAAQGGLSVDGIYEAVRTLGTLSPSGTFEISFLDGRHDGAGAVRDLGFSNSCGCFEYKGSELWKF